MKTLKTALIAFVVLGVAHALSAIPLSERLCQSNERTELVEIVLCDQNEQTIDIYGAGGT